MNPITYRLRLDCSKPGTQASIYVKKGDIRTRQLTIALYNNSVPYEIAAGTLVVLRAIKPDDTIVYDDCTVNGNIITHLITANTLASAGTVRCELTVYGADNEALFTPWFNLYVTDPLYADDDVESSNEFSALTQTMSQANALTNKWNNPRAEVVDGETAGAEVTVEQDGVVFRFTFPPSRAAPIYSGITTVTPKANEQTVLETANKLLPENVTVLEVPYYEVSNTSGKTVYIAQNGGV